MDWTAPGVIALVSLACRNAVVKLAKEAASGM